MQSLGANIPNETWIWKERWIKDDVKETFIEGNETESQMSVLTDVIHQYKNLESDVSKNKKKRRLFGLYYS